MTIDIYTTKPFIWFSCDLAKLASTNADTGEREIIGYALGIAFLGLSVQFTVWKDV